MNTNYFLNYIETAAPLKYAENWDQSGIQIAGNKEEIKRLAISLDPALPIIKQALLWEADFILTHHPLTLTPQLPKIQDDYRSILQLMLQAGTWLYAAHTSLDVQTRGPVSWLAHKLGLNQFSVIHPIDYILPLKEQCGYGILGNTNQNLSKNEFLTKLSQYLPAQHITCVGEWPKSISRIAYCPGSGMFLAQKAFNQGAQVFISGDLKYHQAQELEPHGLTIDAGHFSLEEKMMETWAESIEKELVEKDFEVRFFQGHNPLQKSYDLRN